MALRAANSNLNDCRGQSYLNSWLVKSPLLCRLLFVLFLSDTRKEHRSVGAVYRTFFQRTVFQTGLRPPFPSSVTAYAVPPSPRGKAFWGAASFRSFPVRCKKRRMLCCVLFPDFFRKNRFCLESWLPFSPHPSRLTPCHLPPGGEGFGEGFGGLGYFLKSFPAKYRFMGTYSAPASASARHQRFPIPAY